MFKKYTPFLCCLIVFSVNSFAGDTGNKQPGYSEIEAAERQIIIDELTYRLDTEKTCKPIEKWNDNGSGADQDGYFFIPTVRDNFFMVGGFATQTRKTSLCVITVTEPKNNPETAPRLLADPVDYKLVWTDKGSGAEKDGSMWVAIPPDSNYRCIGSIPQSGYSKPALSNYRCVHVSLAEKVVSNSVIWSDKGSHADKEVTMFRLPNTNSFVAVRGRMSQIETYDLKADPKGTPDPKLVEEKLAMRMKQIQQDLEAGLKADREQKRLAEAAEQKKLAEAEEQKRLAEAAEQKKLAEAEEQKRLAEAAEQKKLAKVEDQKKPDGTAEQKRLAEEAKQKQLAEVTEQKRLAEEAEKKRLAEEEAKLKQMAQEPGKTEAAAGKEIATAERKDKKSGFVNSLVMYLVKIFLVVLGIFIILGIIIYLFSKLFRKKQSGSE